jgi:hypothetical protein
MLSDAQAGFLRGAVRCATRVVLDRVGLRDRDGLRLGSLGRDHRRFSIVRDTEERGELIPAHAKCPAKLDCRQSPNAVRVDEPTSERIGRASADATNTRRLGNAHHVGGIPEVQRDTSASASS